MSTMNGGASAASTAQNAGGTGGNAGAGGAGAQAQPGAQGGPRAGYREVSEADYTAMSRAQQQVGGMQGFFQRANALGLKSTEDLDKWAPVFSASAEGRINPHFLVQALSPQAQARIEAKEEAGMDPAKLRESIMAEVRHERAMEEYQGGLGKEGDVVKAFVQELLGDKADPQEVELYTMAAWGKLHQDRYGERAKDYSYPDGHPLSKSYLRPIDGDLAKPSLEHLRTLRTKRQGGALAGIGDAANNSRPGGGAGASQRSAAGQGGLGGKGPDKEVSGPRAAREAIRARVAAAIEAS